MYILDEISKKQIVKKSHEVATNAFIDNLGDVDVSDLDMEDSYSRYKSLFIDALLKRFRRLKQWTQDDQEISFKRLLDRLSEKGVTEHMVTTPPLCLTVKYKGMTMSFTYSYEGAFAFVDGIEVRVRSWDEDIIELLEIIHSECQPSELCSHVESSLKDYMTARVQSRIMIAIALGIIKKRLAGIEYQIADSYVIDDDICIRLNMGPATINVSGALEDFAKQLEESISVIGFMATHDFEGND